MPHRGKRGTVVLLAAAGLIALVAVTMWAGAAQPRRAAAPSALDVAAVQGSTQMVEAGREIFRYDTFGDEDFWTGQLKLHQAVAGASLGGVGPGVSPKTALSVGLKVDADAIPAEVAAQIKAGKVNLDDPATTLALLKLNAVVGVRGVVSADGKRLESIGITCALCHSTVDDSFAPGIGRRLDGWANRDLSAGAIVALAPDLSPFTSALGVDAATVKKVLASWGPGKFDAELNLDGKAFRPDGKPAATLIPPAFGLAGVNLHTWTADWGTVTYWNAYVANLEMHGKGRFYDPRLDNATQYPVAARLKLGHKNDPVDMITAKLPALHAYQLALLAPKPPAGSFNAAAAARGKQLFSGKARCATCHVPPVFAEPGYNAHSAAEIGIDDFQSNRAPNHLYVTQRLGGLWTHQKGGFYHDGRFATLPDVVSHYDTFLRLNLTPQEKSDLVQYLLSIPE